MARKVISGFSFANSQFASQPPQAKSRRAAVVPPREGRVDSLDLLKSSPIRDGATWASQKADAEKAARLFAPAIPPTQRGIRERDHRVFRCHAMRRGAVIFVRDANPDCVGYMDDANMVAKPVFLKSKTIKQGTNAGLVGCAPADFSSPEAWEKRVAQLTAGGFTVGGPEENYALRNQKGQAFHGDYDLHGTYDAKSGRNVFDAQFSWQLNEGFGRHLLRHPPHDMWSKKNAPGPNSGPQPPVTAYLPDGRAVQLKSVAEMKECYTLYNIPWSALYPND